jgi:hypothetical protein
MAEHSYLCENGHACAPVDLWCGTCGKAVAESPVESGAPKTQMARQREETADLTCPSGHLVTPFDLFCGVCGWERNKAQAKRRPRPEIVMATPSPLMTPQQGASTVAVASVGAPLGSRRSRIRSSTNRFETDWRTIAEWVGLALVVAFIAIAFITH